MRVDGNHGSTLGHEPNIDGEWQEQPKFRGPPLAINGAPDHCICREDDDDDSQPRAPFQLVPPAQQRDLLEDTTRSVGDAPAEI